MWIRKIVFLSRNISGLQFSIYSWLVLRYLIGETGIQVSFSNCAAFVRTSWKDICYYWSIKWTYFSVLRVSVCEFLFFVLIWRPVSAFFVAVKSCWRVLCLWYEDTAFIFGTLNGGDNRNSWRFRSHSAVFFCCGCLRDVSAFYSLLTDVVFGGVTVRCETIGNIRGSWFAHISCGRHCFVGLTFVDRPRYGVYSRYMISLHIMCLDMLVFWLHMFSFQCHFCDPSPFPIFSKIGDR